MPMCLFPSGSIRNDATKATYDKHINILSGGPGPVLHYSMGTFTSCTCYLEDEMVSIPHFRAE